MFLDFIDRLKKQLQAPLPGKEAQYKMAHVVRKSYRSAPDNAAQAATLALFYPKNDEIYIVLIERVSTNKNDRHSGQMSFPGGRYDDTDPSLEYTALREGEEEVGIDKTAIQMIGALTPLYIPVSNFIVYPYVGYLQEAPTFVPQLSEVKSIVEFPFSLLQDPASVQAKDIDLIENMTLKNVPYFNVYEHVVWGATAMMLSELLEVVQVEV